MNKKGQALVEFIIILPVFVFMLLGMIDIGKIMFFNNQIESKMDDVVYEEFKGTGNMEVHLDRKLSERRIFPAIDINKSGTRREDLLLTPKEKETVFALRKAMNSMPVADVTEQVIHQMTQTKNNEEFINKMEDYLKRFK